MPHKSSINHCPLTWRPIFIRVIMIIDAVWCHNLCSTLMQCYDITIDLGTKDRMIMTIQSRKPVGFLQRTREDIKDKHLWCTQNKFIRTNDAKKKGQHVGSLGRNITSQFPARLVITRNHDGFSIFRLHYKLGNAPVKIIDLFIYFWIVQTN